jgi:hypothetical protein
VGDKERDGVSEILRERHVEGRLDADEFQARLERCMAARTYRELDDLIADFPREAGDRRPAEQPSQWRPWPVFLVVPLALFAAIVVGGHLAWLALPLFFLFVVRPRAWRAWGGGYTRGSWLCGPTRTPRA